MLEPDKAANAPSQNKIIDLAAAEGHDADIPTNLGTATPTETTVPPSRTSSNADEREFREKDLVDIEKGRDYGSTPGTEDKEHNVTEKDISHETDPNIVDFTPGDPENPLNWSAARKWWSVALVSLITLLTPLGSSMFAPGVPQLMEDYGSTNNLLAGFVVSVYVLGFAFGPLVIAPLSEMYGRLPLYHTCNVLFVIWNLACGFAPNLSSLIVFRFFAGTFGSAPLALGGGTIADMITQEHRGTAMALWMSGPTAGPVIGPIAGGFISQTIGWRWCFYSLSIAAALTTAGSMAVMRESYGVAILNKRVARLRKETGNPNLRSKLDKGLTSKQLFLYSIVRPAKMLTRSPIVLLLSIYVAIVYTYLYILFTTFTVVFRDNYGFTTGTAGLAYLGIGVGAILGQIVYTLWGNHHARTRMAKGTFKPEDRLPLMFPGAIAMPVGLFWYGWSVQAHVHWICPIIGTTFVGFGLLMIFMAPNTYLVDVFTLHAASAMAANTVLRSVVAAIVPLAGEKMFATLGLGWGASLLGFVAIACIPIPIFFIKYGERIRTKYPVKL
ncbi:MFS general substrate transporter [Aulographum hederae CBS 113979]|uniref:MFS general substrate transporter n=1 Tax=Aulographum hederae CBS 113979 TaxID=1176131 RepID=A0A6G1H605_9PEZI|nr:MFS general substrate transporter [Aulographum hederae CBS 113979]